MYSLNHPKIKSILCLILCIIASIVLYFFTDLNIIYIIDILIFTIFFGILIFIVDKIDLRVSNILFYAILLIPLIICNWFNNSSLATKMSVNYWEDKVYEIVKKECEQECTIHNRTIYNANNIELYKWNGLEYVYEGIIFYKNDDISYQLSLENKCISKNIGENYKIKFEKCK